MSMARKGWTEHKPAHLALLLGLLLVSLAGCGHAARGAEPVPTLPTPAPPPGGPVPSAQIPTALPTPAPPARGWTPTLGVNQIHGVAFAPDGSLWAAATGGVAHWDVEAETYTQYTTADGLPADYANDVALAPDGSVWVATLGGVAHWDGETWTSYSQADGLSSDSVQSVAVAADGQVWVGTVSGVSRFDGRSWVEYLPGVRAWTVAAAPDGSVWAANDGAGVSRYSPADDTWTTYGTGQGVPNAGIKTVAVAPDGTVWIYAGYDQVYRYAGKAWQAVAGISAPWVCDIAFDATGAAWIGTCPGLHGGGSGLLVPRSSAWEQVTPEHGLGSYTVHSIAFRPDGLVAAATEQGLSLYQDGRWRTLRGGPSMNQVTAVAVTPDGSVWLGYGDYSAYRAGGGVSRFDGRAWQYFLEDENATVLALDPEGTLWAGAGCALHRWDGRSWSREDGGCDALQGGVVDLAFGPDGAVWVASGMKLGRFDGQAWTFYDRLVSAVAVAPDSAVWVSGWKGIQGSDYSARFDGSTWVEYPGRKGSLTAAPDGLVWAVAPGEGAVCFDGQQWSSCDGLDNVDLDPRDCLVMRPDGSLWADSRGKLVRLEGEAWQVHPGAIACAPDGSLWLGTSNGVVHWEPDGVGP
jgi:ligand-binding sensor domain-containing protein